MSQTATLPAPSTRRRGLSAGFILVLGVLLIPMALVAAFNSYGAPDAEAYVRMAFAQVAAATIAIGTVVGLVVQRVVGPQRPADIAWFAFIAVIVTSWQVAGLSSATDALLNRLGS